MVKQITIFLENEKGKLLELTKLLENANYDMRSLYIAENADYGIVRIITPSSDACLKYLQDNDYVCSLSDVVVVKVEDKPGGLRNVLEILDKGNFNISYLYSVFSKKINKALLAIKFDDNNHAENFLIDNGVEVVDEDDEMR